MSWYNEATKDTQGQRILIFNCTRGRNSQELLSYIKEDTEKEFDCAIFCPNVTYKGQYKADLLDKREQVGIAHEIKRQWQGEAKAFDSIQEAVEEVQEGSIVLVTGSLHLVGGIMAVLKIY